MDTITIRQLRNDVSRIVRRASAGERLVITSNGVAVAEIGPLGSASAEPTIEELIEAGLVNVPRTRARPQPAQPIEFSGPLTSDEILQDLRGDRV